MLRNAVPLMLLLPAIAAAGTTQTGGHAKFNVVGQIWPSDSLIRDVAGASSIDLQGEFRLNLEWRRGGWRVDGAWQLLGLHGDRLRIAGALPPGASAIFGGVPGDDRRLFDFTDVIDAGSESTLLHRLDRLSVGYASEKTVVRFGRQALSWGSGFFYAPMDLVNPFDPTTIDAEYKTGDDMLYAQVLRGDGDDIQAAAVFRRDPLSGSVESDEATIAVKYHGFATGFEYHLLGASSFGDSVLGLSLVRSIGGANWQADLVVTDTDNETEFELVTNLAYSWTFGGRNMSGVIEYYFNGFGQRDGRLDPASLAGNPDLIARLTRGRSFALGRHYLAGSVMIEMTPLWTLTPVLLANVADPSALLQLTTSVSVADDVSVLGSINLPLGPAGTEFGGIESGIAGRNLSGGTGVFVQLAWYF